MEAVKAPPLQDFHDSCPNLSTSTVSSISCASQASISDLTELQRSFDSCRGRVEASGVDAGRNHGRKDDGSRRKKPLMSSSSSFVDRRTFGNLQSELHQPMNNSHSSFFFVFNKIRNRKEQSRRSSQAATVKLDPIEQSSFAGLEQVAAANIAPARRASMKTSSVLRRMSGSHNTARLRTSSNQSLGANMKKTSTAKPNVDVPDNGEGNASTSDLAYHASQIGRDHADSAVSLCMRRESFQSLKKKIAESGLVTTQGLHQMLHATSPDGDNFVMDAAASVEAVEAATDPTTHRP